MANCYLCGKYIAPTKHHLRRRVRTGGNESIRFGKDRAVTARTSYGMRVLCYLCCTKVDLAKRNEIIRENWKLVAALVLLILVSIARLLNL